MRKLMLFPLLLISMSLLSQKKNDSIPIKKVLDTVVVISFSVHDFNVFMQWLDNVRCPTNGEIKDAEKLIYDRVKLIKK